MEEVHFISAKFSGDLHYFEPAIVSLVVQTKPGTFAECFGVYIPTVPDDEGHDYPALCLRRASWNYELDRENYNKKVNKREYIKGGQSIEAVSIFLPEQECTEIRQLISQANDMVEQGFVTEQVKRENCPWFSVKIKIASDRVNLDMAYTPFSTRIQALESWLEKWKSFFSKIDLTKGIQPEGDFSVTYHDSLQEQMSSFVEM
ncbi:hypothetical protein KTT_40010 [Tengunoibacter tsumagoiensis]|uniref:Uncharacterized protein n=2 Tax=Tengunoibacter tsumagoiensis TaxID=2014871 RepID=A0A402A4W2_9CHLR|nr:hypothetical protein KTT_40010 [Tengunoibacter tsumagoiensis]